MARIYSTIRPLVPSTSLKPRKIFSLATDQTDTYTLRDMCSFYKEALLHLPGLTYTCIHTYISLQHPPPINNQDMARSLRRPLPLPFRQVLAVTIPIPPF